MKRTKLALTSSAIIISGILVRLIYILNTSVFERTHDVGTYTDLSDSLINPGHLGYIEYIAKFGHLPDFDPFKLFSYYHPPLHHILSAIVVKISSLFTDSVDTCFENVQYLVLAFSAATLIIAYFFLKELATKDWQVIAGLLLFTFHPSLIYMSAYVNNDMLTIMFEALGLYFTVKWIKTYRFKYLILMAFALGFGMCTKISAVVIAIPMGVLMLMHLIDEAKEKRAWRCIREYACFALISIGLGLSWTVRNIIRFSTKPGIASATPDDIKYMGDYSIWQRLTIPGNWGFDYPFHNEYGSVSDNAWLILFKTSIFGEIRPDISPESVIWFQAALIAAIIAGLGLTALTIWVIIREIRRGDRTIGIFMLSGYLAIMLSYIAFVIKYPYTCSCDFRYIAIVLLFGGAAIGRIRKYE